MALRMVEIIQDLFLVDAASDQGGDTERLILAGKPRVYSKMRLRASSLKGEPVYTRQCAGVLDVFKSFLRSRGGNWYEWSGVGGRIRGWTGAGLAEDWGPISRRVAKERCPCWCSGAADCSKAWEAAGRLRRRMSRGSAAWCG